MAEMNAHGKFNKSEAAATGPGGSLSTPKKRELVPADHFLLPEKRKFPFKVNGKISCDLLRAAQVRAKQNGYTAVAKEAKSLFDKHCGA